MQALTTIGRPSLDRAEDADLVIKAREGDHDAFSVLTGRHRARVYGKARAILGNDAAAEDVCQEAFVLAYENLSTLKEPQAFLAWVLTIATNAARQQLKERRETTVDCPPESDPDPRDDIGHSELRADLFSLIQELSPQMSQLTHLHYIEGLDHEDIAEALNMPLGTVSGMLTRARGELKARFERRQRREEAWLGRQAKMQTEGVLDAWCYLCGDRRLEWRLLRDPDGSPTLATYCAQCSGDPPVPITCGPYPCGGGSMDDGFLAGFDHSLAVAEAALAAEARCPACAGRMLALPSAVSRFARVNTEARLISSCTRCDYAVDSRVAGLLLAQGPVHKFWREYEPIIMESQDRRLRLTGANCWQISYRAARRQARLRVIVKASSLELVSVEVDCGRSTTPAPLPQ
jgi:RNA polymerase sigma-70 factor (ECF subfamily)